MSSLQIKDLSTFSEDDETAARIKCRKKTFERLDEQPLPARDVFLDPVEVIREMRDEHDASIMSGISAFEEIDDEGDLAALRAAIVKDDGMRYSYEGSSRG